MATLLMKSKSFISRKMNGTSNMTLETLADLAFALDRAVEIRLRSRHPQPGQNFGGSYHELPDPKPVSDATSEKVSIIPTPSANEKLVTA